MDYKKCWTLFLEIGGKNTLSNFVSKDVDLVIVDPVLICQKVDNIEYIGKNFEEFENKFENGSYSIAIIGMDLIMSKEG